MAHLPLLIDSGDNPEIPAVRAKIHDSSKKNCTLLPG
jgi:hypothetical protein